jgi:hypothetical protein
VQHEPGFVLEIPIRSAGSRPALALAVSSQFAALFLPFLLIPPLPREAFPYLGGGIFVAMIVAVVVLQRRSSLALQNMTVRIDDVGLELKRNAVTLWKLPWTNFGGYRRSELSFLKEALSPEEFGVSILDRSNNVVGVLPTRPSASSEAAINERMATDGAARQVLFMELERRTQPPFSSWSGQLDTPAANTPLRIAVALSVGLVAFALAVALVTPYFTSVETGEPLPDWMLSPRTMVLNIVLFAVACWGLVAGANGLLFRWNRRRIRALQPLTGFAERSLAFAQMALPIERKQFESGSYEVSIEPQALSSLKVGAGAAIILYAFVIVIGVFLSMEASLIALILTTMFAIVALPILILAWLSILRIRSNADRIIHAGDSLTVTKADGTTIHFPKCITTSGSGRLLYELMEVNVWKGEGGFYAFSRLDLKRLS